MGTDWTKVKNFTQKEFRYDPEKVAPELVYLLDDFRALLGQRVYINVAWSSSGHSPKSFHYTGMAVDFHCKEENYLDQYALLREFHQLRGVGFYPEWAIPGWHVDLRTEPLQWIFRNNAYHYGHRQIADAIRERVCK